MPRDLVVQIRQNPSADFTLLPSQGGPGYRPGPRGPEPLLPDRGDPGYRPGQRGSEPLDLEVSLRRHGTADLLHMSANRPGERSPLTRGHHAFLDVPATRLLQRAARLRAAWRDQLVNYQTTDEDGMPLAYPFASAVDLSDQVKLAENRMTELAEEGRYLLETMLEGPDRNLAEFRAFLVGALTEEGPLRVSFDSDLHLPWPMMAVDSGPGEPWKDFLGHRHQVEQTGSSYQRIQVAHPTRARAVTSLNTDATLESVGRAPEVRKLLEERTELTVRTESARFLEALAGAVLDEDLMYFWCHGQFVDNGTPFAQLAVRLSDTRDIDADLVRRQRRAHLDEPEALFRPFVLLNACHAGQSAAAELEHLGRALVELGARGVLGPQIEIPQVFAAEYAFAFLDLYLTGEFTAGEITRELARRFVDDYGNPLALTYSLHCGIDSILELTT
ncbi:CHAT domain-containing protein [Kitasatospora sp. NPDC058201]|uniref:CHAT domain-containing protein n=1 Tax=unclassified Kitasatospora TaxID=2633591 RepID=UPI003664BC28